MAELLAIASGAASSADFTVATDKIKAVFLKNDGTVPIPAKARVYVEIKDSANAYHIIGTLDVGNSALTVPGGTGTITYRARRSAESDAIGVEAI